MSNWYDERRNWYCEDCEKNLSGLEALDHIEQNHNVVDKD